MSMADNQRDQQQRNQSQHQSGQAGSQNQGDQGGESQPNQTGAQGDRERTVAREQPDVETPGAGQRERSPNQRDQGRD